jgi:hypothetical protein
MIGRWNGPGRESGLAHRVVSIGVALAVGVVVYACDRTTSPPTAPPNGRARVSPSAAVTPGVTTLCKVGPGATFDVRVGLNAAPQNLTVNGGSCTTVATVNPAAADDVIISIAEKSASYYALDHILLDYGSGAPQTITGTNTVSFEAAHGAIVTFYNNAVVSVCKEGTNATFQYQVGLGDTFHPLSLADGECSNIATVPPAAADDVIVTVREDGSPTYRLDHVAVALGGLSAQTITGQTSVSFEAVHGARATFYNVPVTPTSVSGCTFTQGYYKNKGRGLLPAGNFFLSGQTWLAVLETAPKQGNAYYILAHQYIAAVINAKSASVPPSVAAAIAGATTYFGKASPNDWSENGSYTKGQLTGWSDLLDSYNNGKLGPGHCD